MKKNRSLLIGIVLVSLTSLTSCKKEGCTYENATNYSAEADKDDGSCVFETKDTTTIFDPRDEFLGNYSALDSSFNFGNFNTKKNYILSISKVGPAGSDTIHLNNLWNSGNTIYAILYNGQFSIPSQFDNFSNIEGSGSFDGNKITYTASGANTEHRGSGTK